VISPELPYNEEGEQNALAVMLMNAPAAKKLSEDLRPEHFYSPAHQHIFGGMVEMIATDKKVDPVTLGEYLRECAPFRDRGGVTYLHGLAATDALAAHAGAYAQIIREHAQRRGELRIAEELAEGRIDALAAAEALQRIVGDRSPATVEDAFVDWPAFWGRDRSQAEWVFPDVLARGRGHAIYAAHKEGKSLFLLYIAAKLATGKEPIVVIYLDYEMGEDDLSERLEDMGYGPGTDLSCLRYALFPACRP
jgi:hypothetical protein